MAKRFVWLLGLALLGCAGRPQGPSLCSNARQVTAEEVLAAKGKNLAGCQLIGVNLANAKLAGLNLSEAVVQGAVFLQADLSGANLAKAYVENSAFNLSLIHI